MHNIKKYFFDSIDSTNNEAKAILQEGRDQEFIILSAFQAAGKGRLGRSWSSPNKKGLYATYVMKASIRDNVLPLAVGVSILEAIKNICNVEVKLKWPNDFIVNNKKLGGILIENFRGEILIGIGINLYKSNDRPSTAISIEEIQPNIEKDFMLMKDSMSDAILLSLKENFNLNNQIIIDKFLQNCCFQIGSAFTFIRNNELYNAELVGINDNGALEVKLEDGRLSSLLSEEVSLQGYEL